MHHDRAARVAVAYGTRPEAVKLAPLIHTMRDSTAGLEPVIVVSGQHREMLDQINVLFGIVPDADFDIIAPGQSLDQITRRAIAGFSAFFAGNPVDAVVVQGDTTTTFAAALSAFYLNVPVVHVEAGLRTWNLRSPFPEEINRRLTTQLANLHLAPTDTNRSNLVREGVDAASIRVTGNTVIDAFLDVSARRVPVGISAIDDAISKHRRIVLVTAHRRESWGDPMRSIGRATARLADAYPDVLFVLPAHKNPTVRESLLPAVTGFANVVVTEPMDYAPFCSVISAATLVLTDSGGVQEEAPSAGKPVLVLRDTTERPEAVHAGTVELVGAHEERIVARSRQLLDDREAYGRMARAVNPYGDGQAASRCVAAIAAMLDRGAALPDFVGPELRRVR